MDKYNRKVMFCDLRITTNKQHILPDPLLDLLKVLETYLASSEAVMHRGGGKLAYFVSDVILDEANDIACLYVSRHDENGSDPAISTKETEGGYKTKVVEKLENQGNAAGAHILIHLAPRNTTDGHFYYTAVEAANGLGRSISQSLLRSVFNDIYVKDPNAMTGKRTTSTAKKAEPYRPLFEFLGMPVDFINADLAEAQGVDLRVVRSRPTESMGRAAANLQAEETVLLKPTKKRNFPTDVEGIKEIIKAVPGKLLSGRFSYKLRGTQQPVHFKIEGESVLLDELLVQSTLVGPTKGKMADITPNGKIHAEFKGLMTKVLLDKIKSLG